MQDLKKFTSVYENTRVCTSEVFVRSRWMTTTLDNVALSTNSHGLFSYVVSISAKVRQLVSCCGIVDLRRDYFVQTTFRLPVISFTFVSAGYHYLKKELII